jgi:hypothetical protein
MQAELKARIYKLIAEKGATNEMILDVRQLEKIDRVMDAASIREAEELIRKAEGSIYICCLHLQATKKIFPKTPEAFHNKADSAESWATRLWEQYTNAPSTTPAEANKKAKILKRHQEQLLRVRNLREYAARLKLDPTIPSFDELYGKDEEVQEEEQPKEPVVRKPRRPRRPTPKHMKKRRRA